MHNPLRKAVTRQFVRLLGLVGGAAHTKEILGTGPRVSHDAEGVAVMFAAA